MSCLLFKKLRFGDWIPSPDEPTQLGLLHRASPCLWNTIVTNLSILFTHEPDKINAMDTLHIVSLRLRSLSCSIFFMG
jgi:hypothetical protein